MVTGVELGYHRVNGRGMKRRSLVLTDETARNPFLAGLPPHIRLGVPAVAVPRSRITAQDVKEFFLAYCACFVAVSAYLA